MTLKDVEEFNKANAQPVLTDFDKHPVPLDVSGVTPDPVEDTQEELPFESKKGPEFFLPVNMQSLTPLDQAFARVVAELSAEVQSEVGPEDLAFARRIYDAGVQFQKTQYAPIRRR